MVMKHKQYERTHEDRYAVAVVSENQSAAESAEEEKLWEKSFGMTRDMHEGGLSLTDMDETYL